MILKNPNPPNAANPDSPEEASETPLARYLPTLSLVRGFGSTFVLQTSATLFKNLGVANSVIGYMSLFSLPASLKFLWGPVADCYGTKRTWALGASCGLAAGILAMAVTLLQDPVSVPTLLFFYGLCAVAYGVSDFASEGFFVCAVAPSVRHTGIVLLTAFSRLSSALLGGVIFCAGFFSDAFASLRLGWAVALGILGAMILILTLYNHVVMPRPAADRPAKSEGGSIPWREIFLSYRETPRFWIVILYILAFRFGENIVMRLSQVFFVEPRATGGLGLSLQQVSFAGLAGLATLIGGGLLSMALIKGYGIRRMMVPLSLAMVLPNVLYILLAMFPAYDGVNINLLGWLIHLPQLAIVTVVQCSEYLGYGLGFTFYFSVVVALAHGRYRASHMAFGNAVMLIGYMVPNAIGGVIQEAAGWTGLFIFAVVCFIPGFCLLFFLPASVIDTDNSNKR